MNAAASLFLDTNVLVYAHDQSEPVKGPVARVLVPQIFAAGQPVLSTQVVAEFYWNVTRKLTFPITHAEAVAEINRFHALGRVVSVEWRTLEKALVLVDSHHLAVWDAQLLAAAALNGATHILTEDFQHRHTLEGVTFLNPFAPDFDLAEILGP